MTVGFLIHFGIKTKQLSYNASGGIAHEQATNSESRRNEWAILVSA